MNAMTIKRRTLLLLNVAFIGANLFIVVLPAQSQSQNAVPELKEIIESIKQNQRKVSNVLVRSSRVSVLSPDFEGEAKSSGLSVKDKRVSIDRDLILLDGDNRFVNHSVTDVGADVLLQKESKYWFDAVKNRTTEFVVRSQHLNDKGEVQDVLPSAYERKDGWLPLGTIEALQINLNGLSVDINYSDKSKVVGFEMYRGLKCVKIEWGEKNKTSSWGIQLICPTRDWKILYQEAYTEGISDKFKRLYQKNVIQGLEKHGDAWVPSGVYIEYKKVGFKGEESSFLEEIKILDFAIDTVDESLLFAPLLPPGTVHYGEGKADSGYTIAGGSIQTLVTQAQKGNFSFIKEATGDLTGA